MGRGARPKSPHDDPIRAPIEPEQPFVAIGDIHGRADLLLELDGLINTKPREG